MTIAEFERLLDVYGSDRTRWPVEARASAGHLVARDRAARRLLAEAEALLGNPISERLAAGWYPSGLDQAGYPAHDRHVLIWVRNYEAILGKLRNDAPALLDLLDDACRDLSNAHANGFESGTTVDILASYLTMCGEP